MGKVGIHDDLDTRVLLDITMYMVNVGWSRRRPPTPTPLMLNYDGMG
jgi:hypothetical protein